MPTPPAFTLTSKSVRYKNDKRQPIPVIRRSIAQDEDAGDITGDIAEDITEDITENINDKNTIILDYVETYKLNSATPRDSLAKNYETTNDLVITLEIPKSDYKNPHVQNILYWADLPIEHDDFYRDLAVTIKNSRR